MQFSNYLSAFWFGNDIHDHYMIPYFLHCKNLFRGDEEGLTILWSVCLSVGPSVALFHLVSCRGVSAHLLASFVPCFRKHSLASGLVHGKIESTDTATLRKVVQTKIRTKITRLSKTPGKKYLSPLEAISKYWDHLSTKAGWASTNSEYMKSVMGGSIAPEKIGKKWNEMMSFWAEFWKRFIITSVFHFWTSVSLRKHSKHKYILHWFQILGDDHY